MSDNVKRGWLEDGSGKISPNTYLDQVFNADGTKFENKFKDVSDIVGTMDTEVDKLGSDAKVLKARVDGIASLPEGSTSGDAELIDIRVKTDGTTATTAGNAVREQFVEIKEDIANITITKFENIASKILWSVYNGFPYLQDYYDEEKEVNSSVCPVGKTSYGFYWDIPIVSGHKYLIAFSAKVVNAGDNTATVSFSRQAGTSTFKAVKDVFGVINGITYNNKVNTSDYSKAAGIIDATTTENIRLRGFFYPSANYDSVYAYKDVVLVDITDSYSKETVADILESDYFKNKSVELANQKDIEAVSARVDILEENKILYTFDDVKAIASKSANATVTDDEITVNGIGLDTPSFILPIKAEYQGAVVFSMYAKASDITISDNNVPSSIQVRFYDKNGTRIHEGQRFPILSTDYKLYEYHACIPMGAYKAELRFCSYIGSSFTFKTFSAKKVEIVAPISGHGVHFDCHLGIINAPMNTMEAYIGARIAGFSNLIFNLRQTADGVLVCMHDDDISHYSNGTGLCSEMTYEQLRAYNFAYTSNNKDSAGNIKNPYYDCKIVKVEEVLKMCAINGIVPVLRLNDALDSTYTQIKEMLYRYGLNGIARCKAFDFNILQKAWDICGDAFYSYSFEVDGAFTQTHINTFKSKEYCSDKSFIECKHTALTESLVSMARESGLAVGIASIGNFAVINKCIELGATYITSDFSDGCPMIC